MPIISLTDNENNRWKRHAKTEKKQAKQKTTEKDRGGGGGGWQKL